MFPIDLAQVTNWEWTATDWLECRKSPSAGMVSCIFLEGYELGFRPHRLLHYLAESWLPILRDRLLKVLAVCDARTASFILLICLQCCNKISLTTCHCSDTTSSRHRKENDNKPIHSILLHSAFSSLMNSSLNLVVLWAESVILITKQQKSQ